MININKTARFAGFLYLLMVPFALFGILYVPSLLIVPGDIVTTIKNIIDSESLFRLSIVSALIVQIIQILLVITLYKLLKPVNKTLASMMVIFILMGVPIAMLSELNKFAVLILLNGYDGLNIFEPSQLQNQVQLFLELYKHGIFIAQIFWGLWLLPFGYLVFKSGYLPKFLGVLLIIGGIYYLVDFSLFALLPNIDFKVPEIASIGELTLPLWLLIKGVKVKEYEKLAHR